MRYLRSHCHSRVRLTTSQQFPSQDFKKDKVYNYAVSVPYSKVRINEVMLAYEMNGEVSQFHFNTTFLCVLR